MRRKNMQVGSKGFILTKRGLQSIEPLTHGFLLILAFLLDLEPVAMPGFATTPQRHLVKIMIMYL